MAIFRQCRKTIAIQKRDRHFENTIVIVTGIAIATALAELFAKVFFVEEAQVGQTGCFAMFAKRRRNRGAFARKNLEPGVDNFSCFFFIYFIPKTQNVVRKTEYHNFTMRGLFLFFTTHAGAGCDRPEGTAAGGALQRDPISKTGDERLKPVRKARPCSLGKNK